jgi:hypothetical protein
MVSNVGIFDESRTINRQVRAMSIAEVCHEANRSFRSRLAEHPGPEWDHESDEIRQGVIRAVKRALDEPLVTAARMHEEWMHDREKAGWVYGPEKDSKAKTHPCLVAYNELPDSQKAKDVLFLAIVGALRNVW